MKKILSNTTICFLLILCVQSLFATVLPIPFNNRINKSNQIIMARAISSESYWDANHTRIYTAFTMEVTAYLKNASTAATFDLILPGGEVDGDLEIVTPNASIEIGTEYLLLLENANSNSTKPTKNGTALKKSQFQLYSHVQGILIYKDGKYYDFMEQEPMDEEVMMEKVKKITGKIAKTPNGDNYNPRVVIKDNDKDGICSLLDCDDKDPNYPMPVGAPCNDGNSSTKNDQIQADGCTCAGNSGQPLNCDALTPPVVEGNTIRIDKLLAKSERVELTGIETNGQKKVICDGDCTETHFIEGLELGNKIVGIWMFDDQNDSCYKEFVVEVREIALLDTDGDDVFDIKDCAPNNPNYPATPGIPCDDGNPNTLRDIILADGCSCAGVEACPVDTETGGRPLTITLKNVAGEINPLFFTGSIEEVDELIIEGSGFGTTPGIIEFANSDSGGRTLTTIDYETDISMWSDTRISVKIPSRAGTGNVLVKNSSGSTVGSAPINISYAINTLYSSFRSFDSKTRQNIKFTNRNEAGGYTIQLNTTSGFAGSSAVLPFEQAMDTWVCASGVNWQVDKSGTTEGFANDGNSVILYEPNLPLGVLGITTSRYKASGNSSCSFHNTVWYLKEFDIQFVPNESMGNFSWNFGPWPPQINQYDFQSIALHELGHAHGLGHVIDEDEIMHYSVRNGVQRRTITTHAHDGGNSKIALSTQPNCISSHEPMTLLQPAGCVEVIEERNTSARVNLMLQGYYDINSNSLSTNLLDNDLLPEEAPFDIGKAVTVSSFPANVVDWLLIELRDENDMQTVVAQKCVFINSAGSLVDITGDDLLTFEDLDDKNYYIAVFHKSHLPIISSNAQPLNDDPAVFDFASAATTTMGDNQQTQIEGQFFMSSGDFDGNGIVNSLDFNLWKQAGAGVNQYSPADADGNGIINSLDFNLWKANSSKISVLSN